MSANLTAGGSDLYATIDLSKKRKKKLIDTSNESAQDSKFDIPLYAVVDKNHRRNSQLDKNTEVFEQLDDTSTEVTKDLDCENKRAKNEDTGYYLSEKSLTNSWFTNKLAIAFFIALIVVMGVMIVILFVKVGALESSQIPYNLSLLNQVNMTGVDYRLFDDEVLSLNKTLSELSYEFQQKLAIVTDDLKGLSYQFQQVLSNISALFKEETDINEFLLNASVASCADILRFNPSSSSGYYTFRSSTGQVTSVYCDMVRTCGNNTGGWMRVTDLDLYNCPTGLKSKLFNGIRTCIQNEVASGCTPILYSSFNIPYSKICGQIRGYGVGTIDGLYKSNQIHGNSVNDNYLDGISISSNGNHVWSFVAGDCRCDGHKHAFIGNDWTCAGTGCGRGNICPSLLWNTSTCGMVTPFFKDLSLSTTADVVMRVCRDEDRNNEDIAITSVELYVQ